jgi:hypothetical protein
MEWRLVWGSIALLGRLRPWSHVLLPGDALLLVEIVLVGRRGAVRTRTRGRNRHPLRLGNDRVCDVGLSTGLGSRNLCFDLSNVHLIFCLGNVYLYIDLSSVHLRFRLGNVYGSSCVGSGWPVFVLGRDRLSFLSLFLVTSRGGRSGLRLQHTQFRAQLRCLLAVYLRGGPLLPGGSKSGKRREPTALLGPLWRARFEDLRELFAGAVGAAELAR